MCEGEETEVAVASRIYGPSLAAWKLSDVDYL